MSFMTFGKLRLQSKALQTYGVERDYLTLLYVQQQDIMALPPIRINHGVAILIMTHA